MFGLAKKTLSQIADNKTPSILIATFISHLKSSPPADTPIPIKCLNLTKAAYSDALLGERARLRKWITCLEEEEDEFQRLPLCVILCS